MNVVDRAMARLRRPRAQAAETPVVTVEARPPEQAPGWNGATVADVPPAPTPPPPTPDLVRELDVVATDVSKRFGDRDVITDLSFEVERGRIFGIVGPSGGGKTTAIKMLLGVLRPTSGKLSVLGRAPHRFRRRDRQKLGYMPQLFVLFPELSVMENLNFSASIYGMGWFGRGKRLRASLDFVELWDARSKTAGQLSGGMQRRLELAATLIHNPQLIFLDEPTAGIDPVLRAKFWDHFRKLRDEGRTLIVTTQYVTESEYCDRVAVLKEGRLIAIGSPEDVRRNAMGGEVIQVTGPDLDRHAVLAIRSLDGVQRVRRVDDTRLEVIVEDAGRMVPDVLEALRTAQIEVGEVEELRPTFDEVFVRLMEDADARATSSGG